MNLNRTIQPEIHPIEKINYLTNESFKLSNGIDVYSMNYGNQDVTRIEVAFEAGSYFTTKKLVSGFTASMISEGSKHKDSALIAEIIDSQGAYLEINADKDYALASLFCLSKNLDKLVPLLSEILTEAIFPEHEFNVLVNNKLQSHQINNQKVGYIARNRFLSMITGENHPYGRYAEQNDYQSLNRKDLIDFYSKNYSFEHCKIFISGKVDENALNLLEKYFGFQKKLKTKNTSEIQHKISSGENRRLDIQIENAVQNAIRIGHETIHRNHPDYHKLKITNTILGGYFGSRLMTNIREDKGYTYGIGSAIVSYKNASFFFVSSEVKSENTKDVLYEINEEIEKLKNQTVSEEELFLVKNYLLGSFQRSFDGVFAQADRLRDGVLMQFGYNYYDKYIETIRSIHQEEICNIAKKYLSLENSFIINVGKI